MKTKLLLLAILFTTNVCAQFFAIDKSTIIKEGIENILITKIHKGKEKVEKYYRFDKKNGLIHSSYIFNNYDVSKNIKLKDVNVFAKVYCYDKKGLNVEDIVDYKFPLFQPKKSRGQVLPSGGLDNCNFHKGNDTIRSFSVGFCWAGIKTIDNIYSKGSRTNLKYHYDENNFSELVRSIDVSTSWASANYSYNFYYNSSVINDSLLDKKIMNKDNRGWGIFPSHLGARYYHNAFSNFDKVVKVDDSLGYARDVIKFYDSTNYKVIEKQGGGISLRIFESFSVKSEEIFWSDRNCESFGVKNEISYLFNSNLEFLYYYYFLFDKSDMYDDDDFKFSYAIKQNCETTFLLTKGIEEYGDVLDTLSATLYSDDEYIRRRGGYNKLEVIKKPSKDDEQNYFMYSLYYTFNKD